MEWNGMCTHDTTMKRAGRLECAVGLGYYHFAEGTVCFLMISLFVGCFVVGFLALIFPPSCFFSRDCILPVYMSACVMSNLEALWCAYSVT